MVDSADLRKADARNDRQESDQFHHGESGPQDDGRYEYSEEWRSRSDDLMELQTGQPGPQSQNAGGATHRDRHELQGDVADCDVDRVEDRECRKNDVFARCQSGGGLSRVSLVTLLNCG